MIERRAAFLSKRRAIADSGRWRLIVAATITAAFLAGCRQSKDTARNSASSSAQQTAQGQTQGEASPALQPPQSTPGQQANAEPLDLNRELRKWILKNRRPPKNFDDFAGSSGVEVPPPPDGKKYAIDKTMHVILVKR